MRKHAIWFVTLCVAVSGGCNDRDSQDMQGQMPDVAASESDAGAMDLATTQEVRRRIEADDSLSGTAQSVTIQTDDGVVTLTGPVTDAREKAAIEMIARQTQGVSRVENKLEVEDDVPAVPPI